MTDIAKTKELAIELHGFIKAKYKNKPTAMDYAIIYSALMALTESLKTALEKEGIKFELFQEKDLGR